jgi:hypothetical protein
MPKPPGGFSATNPLISSKLVYAWPILSRTISAPPRSSKGYERWSKRGSLTQTWLILTKWSTMRFGYWGTTQCAARQRSNSNRSLVSHPYRVQLFQVVLNLLMNGLEAVAELAASDRRESVRTVELDNGFVELMVEDSGRGIAEGDLARVFEPFFSTKPEGLGMGLSISRSIVQVHGGRICAENNVGSGAVFHCVLPAAQHAPVASAK